MKSAKYITLYVFCLDFIVINEAAVIDSKCALLKLTVEGGVEICDPEQSIGSLASFHSASSH